MPMTTVGLVHSLVPDGVFVPREGGVRTFLDERFAHVANFPRTVED
ncbi:hypothetical protein [Archangium sp.]|jgi:hypothetical protein